MSKVLQNIEKNAGDICYLGIDTSNYTTSVAFCDGEGHVFESIRVMLDVKEGERGLRQSDAVFAHLKNIKGISEQIREAAHGKRIVAAAVSAKPRDVEGSYMPCFVAGEAIAQTAAALLDIPLYKLSHQRGHVYAALYSAGALHLAKREFAAFHVSGGTTEILKVVPDEKDIISVSLAGGTRDISAGQAIDRAGVMMGLKFPCGVEMEKAALRNVRKLPKLKISTDELFCNFSGLENMAKKWYDAESEADTDGRLSYISAAVLDFVKRTLSALTMALRDKYPDIPIIFAGGVMSNKIIGQALAAEFSDTYFSEPRFSADNAAGIALLCREKFLKNHPGD